MEIVNSTPKGEESEEKYRQCMEQVNKIYEKVTREIDQMNLHTKHTSSINYDVHLQELLRQKNMAYRDILKKQCTIHKDIDNDLAEILLVKPVEEALLQKFQSTFPSYYEELKKSLDEILSEVVSEIINIANNNLSNVKHRKEIYTLEEKLKEEGLSSFVARFVGKYEVDPSPCIMNEYINIIENTASTECTAILQSFNSFMNEDDDEWEIFIKKHLNSFLHGTQKIFYPGLINPKIIQTLMDIIATIRCRYIEHEHDQYHLESLARLLSVVDVLDQEAKTYIRYIHEVKYLSAEDRIAALNKLSDIFQGLVGKDDFIRSLIIFSLCLFYTSSYLHTPPSLVVEPYNAKDRQMLQEVLIYVIKRNEDKATPATVIAIFERVIAEYAQKVAKENSLDNMPYDGFEQVKAYRKDETNTIDLFRYVKDEKRSIFNDSGVDKHSCKDSFINLCFMTPKIVSKHVVIAISGFLSADSNMKTSWKNLIAYDPNVELYDLNWAAATTTELLTGFLKAVAPVAIAGLIPTSGIAALTVKLALPSFGSLGTSARGCFKQTRTRSKIVGKILAHLVKHKHPFKNQAISLIAFSLGTQVILSCIKELYRIKEFNCIHNAYLLGGAAHIKSKNISKWANYFKVVSGRIVNVCTKNDHILLLYTSATGNYAIGRNKIDVLKVDNVDCSDIVGGHLSYRDNLLKILDRINFENLKY